MKKLFGLVFASLLTLSSCGNLLQNLVVEVKEPCPIQETYENTDEEKIFRFGNKNGENVLVVLGMDVYIHRIMNAQGQVSPYDNTTMEQRLVNYCNARIVNSETDKNYSWKDIEFTVENANFFVIVTNNELNIFDNIIKYSREKNMKFDYFLFVFHGNPDYVDSDFQPRALFRGDLIQQVDKAADLQACFKSDCAAIMFSCSVLSDTVTIPFAVFMKAMVGVENFSASKNDVCEKLVYPEFIYTMTGEFDKVADASVDKLKAMHAYYKEYVVVDSVESYEGTNWYYITIKLPTSSLSNDQSDNNLNNYEMIGYYYTDGGDCTLIYKNKANGKVTMTSHWFEDEGVNLSGAKTFSSDFSEFVEFVFDVHMYDNYKVEFY